VDGNTETTAHDQTARIARLAWLFTFVVPLILAALLLGVKSAQAATPVLGLTPLAFEEQLALGEEDELEEEAEFAEEECEIAEEEREEGELGEVAVEAICEADVGTSAADGRCPLRSARARAVERNDRLKVTVGYTTSEPTGATIEVRSGSTRIVSVHRHLGKSGVLRIAKDLGRKQAKRIVVRFRAPSCEGFQTKPSKIDWEL
jgi:hypothetical protein